MENTFDSTYIVNKEKYDDFLKDVDELAIAAYTVPPFIWPELYTMIDVREDIPVRVVWRPETTVKQIKELDKDWFLWKYA